MHGDAIHGIQVNFNSLMAALLSEMSRAILLLHYPCLPGGGTPSSWRQYLLSSWLANDASPTMGLLRTRMRLCQLGSGEVFSHFFSISVKQSLCSLNGAFMASRVPAVNPSPSPMLYHLEQIAISSVSTSTKSSGTSCPTVGNGGYSQNSGSGDMFSHSLSISLKQSLWYCMDP